MRRLRLVSVAESGRAVVLADETGAEFSLALDDRLRAALRGERLRDSQLEITLSSQLTPRDIQARVRAGASVEEVAEVAGVPGERVMRFAAPVLDERAHMAERARAALVRTDGMLELGALGPLVAEAVARRDPEAVVAWDAWRREDGRWLAACRWLEDHHEHTALWLLDSAAGSVAPMDDDARTLAGLPPLQPTGPTRLAVVPDRKAGRGAAADEEAGDVARDDHAASEDDTPTGPIPPVTDVEGPDPVEESSGQEPGATHPSRRHKRARSQPPESERLRLSELSSHVEESDAAPKRPTRKPSRASRPASSAAAGGDPDDGDDGRRQRPPVPSWDEIMFGRRT